MAGLGASHHSAPQLSRPPAVPGPGGVSPGRIKEAQRDKRCPRRGGRRGQGLRRGVPVAVHSPFILSLDRHLLSPCGRPWAHPGGRMMYGGETCPVLGDPGGKLAVIPQGDRNAPRGGENRKVQL